MLRSLIAALILALGGVASAMDINTLMMDLSHTVVMTSIEAGLGFKVGDTASYSLKISSFINGSMVMTVKSVSSTALVIEQDADLGFAGKQACQETINPNTGALEKMVCNGQNQSTDQGSYSVEQEKADTITVAAGTFECLYIKAKNSKDNSEIEQWAAPKKVPVFGMVKALTPSQMGTVDLELTSFKAN